MRNGRREPLRAYEPQIQAPEAYRTAFALMESGDPGAMPAFAALVSTQPQDSLASFHLRRLLNGHTGARIDVNEQG